jgi:hypothetical protein
MSDAHAVSTPIVPSLSLQRLTNAEIDATTYQSAIGSLMYAMIRTRPNLAHAVGVLSQFSANPGEEHWSAIKRVLRYLVGTKDLCIA